MNLTPMEAARRQWWDGLSKQGDPARIVNPLSSGFRAGWEAARQEVVSHDALFVRQLLSAILEIYDWADNHEDVDDGIPNDANRVKGIIIRHLGDNMKQLEVRS